MLLQCFEWALTDQPPEPPHHTQTLTHSQTLEIPHIPSTSLAALQPRRDNKEKVIEYLPAV